MLAVVVFVLADFSLLILYLLTGSVRVTGDLGFTVVTLVLLLFEWTHVQWFICVRVTLTKTIIPLLKFVIQLTLILSNVLT